MIVRTLPRLAFVVAICFVLLTGFGGRAQAADRLLVSHDSVTGLDGYAGVLAWDQGITTSDGNLVGYRIAVWQHGRVRVAGRRFSAPVGPDVGTDRRGRLVLVYALCGPTTCGIVMRDVVTGRERRLRMPGEHAKCRDGLRSSASSPSISHGRIAYLLSPCRGPDRVMLRLASGANRTLARVLDHGGVGSTDIAGSHVVFSEKDSFEPVIGFDVGSKILLVDTRGRRVRVIGHAYNDGMSSDAVRSPVLAAGSAYFLEAADDGDARSSESLHRIPLQGFPRVRLCDYTQGYGVDSLAVTAGHRYYITNDNQSILEDTTPTPTARRCRPPYAVGIPR